MITPSTYEIALLLAVLALFCWGTWAITYKLAGKWRYELYYFDFAFGVVVTTVVGALTFGSMGDELSFWDNLAFTAGRRQVAWAFGGGLFLNLANMLILSSTSISGLALAFPVGLGVAMVVSQAWTYWLDQSGNLTYFVVGMAILLVGVVMNIVAYRAHAAMRKEQEDEHKRALEQIDPAAQAAAAEEAARAQQAAAGDRSYRRRKKKAKADVDAVGTPAKGILLAVVGGIFMGCATPLFANCRDSELGLGPYTIAFVVSIAMFLSTFILNLYFMNLPVQGAPVQFFRYFQGTLMQHLWGFLGGAIWAAGATAAFIVAVVPRSANLTAATGSALVHAAGLLAAVWGVLVYKEYRGASGFSNALMAVGLVLFAAGLGVLTLGGS